MSIDLKPCPFCGGLAVLEHTGKNGWSAGCIEPNASVHFCMGYQSITEFATQHEAIAAWNTRHESSKTEPSDNGWRPIETAPKSGPPIVLGRAGYHPVIGWWIDDEVGWAKASYMGGMYQGYLGGRANIPQPTHWMPLPQPPKEDGES